MAKRVYLTQSVLYPIRALGGSTCSW